MLISVIIPHFNQEEYLAEGLRTLHEQDGVTAAVEIIVVDNGSRRLPDEICRRWPDVMLASEPTPGPGPARNRGSSLAKGSVLAFIDADCRAHPGWLSAIERAFADPAVEIVGGDVQVAYAVPGEPSFIEPYEAVYSYRNKEHIAAGFSGTGNLAVRRQTLEEVGPFAGIEVAEDREWGLRAGARGHRIHYVPEMIVFHPARENLAALTRKWDRHVAHDYHEFTGKPFGLSLWLLRTVAVALSPILELRTVLTSPRIQGMRPRVLAMACLVCIRLHRARAMLRVALDGGPPQAEKAWKRS
ncbi:glycosyltransferase [Lutibaculum baratangense]|uniref:Glycosyl transferase, family 2 n=1 Tax=Lutibaculum baratangense AMV1 TaxID=631454 RepID=V4RA68_9HYPH|nr:glycosyltransferase [Lutibaculum baratangense]ESR23066.1 glycosyl transferase, family 2 [Lutibaculum baratangense AMV1]